MSGGVILHWKACSLWNPLSSARWVTHAGQEGAKETWDGVAWATLPKVR